MGETTIGEAAVQTIDARAGLGTAVPGRRRIGIGAAAFATLSAAGLAGLFAAQGPSGLRPVELRFGYLLLAAAAALLDLLIGALRYQVFLRRMLPGTPLWLPLRADLAGRFIGAVTPSQTGGGPAQVFVLSRGGVPVFEALAFLLVNMVSTLAVLLAAAAAGAYVFRDHFGTGGIHRLVGFGFGVSLAGFALLLAGLLRPSLLSRPIERLAARAGNAAHATLLSRVARRLVGGIDQYRAACGRFVREEPLLPVASLLLTVLMYFNKFALAWVVMRALGIERDLATTVALQALLHLSVFLAPSPGGSGIAEVATGAFMSALVPGRLLGPFTLIYRLLTVYLPAAAGAAILLAELRPRQPSATPAQRAGASPPSSSVIGGGRQWRRRIPALALALALGTVAGPDRADAAPGDVGPAADVDAFATPAASGVCPLCGPGSPETTPLPHGALAAAAVELARRNTLELDRIDGLLREGRLGPPDSAEARGRAQLMARLSLANWYSFLLRFVTDPHRVWSVPPDELAPVVSRYCEAAAVPVPRLRELRLGRGRVCARYRLDGPPEQGFTILGGKCIRYRLRDVGGGRGRRLLGLDWGSAGPGKVEVLVAAYSG